MPRSVVNILLRIRDPQVRHHYENQKPLTYLKTPEDFALFKVMTNCLKRTIMKKVGQEIQIAQINFEFESVDDIAFNIKIAGFSDKLLLFAKILLEIVRACAEEDGFRKADLLDSIEEVRADYANSNIQAVDWMTNNRTNFLMPHTYHTSLME